MKIKMKGTTCTTMNRKSTENKGKKGGKNQIIYFRKIFPDSGSKFLKAAFEEVKFPEKISV